MSKKFSLHDLLIILITLSGLAGLVLAIWYPIVQTTVDMKARIIIASFLALDAIFYFVAAWGVYKRIKWIYYFSILLFSINAIAIIFDEIGFYDILAFALNILLLILLIVDNKKS